MEARDVYAGPTFIGTLSLPNGTPESVWQARIAEMQAPLLKTLSDFKKEKIDLFEEETRKFIDAHYDLRKTDGIIAKMVLNGVVMGDSELVGTLSQVFVWANQVMTYNAEVIAAMNACSTKDQLDAVSWDFSNLNASDPRVSLEELS
jgi:hypothetical protein